MKNSSDTIGNRTRDPPACSTVPQPTAPPHTPIIIIIIIIIINRTSIYTVLQHALCHYNLFIKFNFLNQTFMLLSSWRIKVVTVDQQCSYSLTCGVPDKKIIKLFVSKIRYGNFIVFELSYHIHGWMHSVSVILHYTLFFFIEDILLCYWWQYYI